MNWGYLVGTVSISVIFLIGIIIYDTRLEKQLDERLKLRENASTGKHLKIVRK